MHPSISGRIRWPNVAAAGLLVASLVAVLARPALGPELPVAGSEEAPAMPQRPALPTPTAAPDAEPRARVRRAVRRVRRPPERATPARRRHDRRRAAPPPPPAASAPPRPAAPPGGEFGFERRGR